MLHRTDPAKRVDPACPPEVANEIRAHLAAGVSGQGILRGETLGQLVDRVCPEVYGAVERYGFRITFDMPENSHRALCKGRLNYVIRRIAEH